MTVSTTQPAITVGGNNSQTVFQFPFIGVSASDIEVIFADTSGSTTTLPSTAYSVMLNAPITGQLWPQGGSVTYPLTGSPIADGTKLTISRILPLTQLAEISNQGNQYPTVTEKALDILCMEIQQVSARTGQLRGTWVPDAFYNFGDIVQDGVNGSNSGNYYLAAIANESGVWATDLANGYWSLAIQATIPEAPLPLSVANGGTGASTPGAALNNLGGISLSGNNAFTGNNTHSGSETFSGPTAVSTAGAGDSSSKIASTNFVNGTALNLTNGTVATTQTGSDNSTKVATTAQVLASILANVVASTGSSVVLLGTQTASNNSSLNFSSIPTSYDQYVLKFTSVVPITNNALLNIQLGNPSIISASYSWSLFATASNGGSGAHATNSDSSFPIAFSGVSNTSGIGLSGEITFSGLGSANQAMANYHYEYFDGTNSVNESGGGRQAGTAGPFSVIKLLMSSGNIASGKFSLYGVKTS